MRRAAACFLVALLLAACASGPRPPVVARDSGRVDGARSVSSMSDTAWTYTRTPADDGEPHSPAGSSAQAPHRPVTACTGLRPEVVGGMGPGEHCLHVEIEVGHDREIKRARLLCAYPNPDLIVNANQLLGLVEGEPALAQQRVEPGSFQTWLGIRGRSGRAPHCR